MLFTELLHLPGECRNAKSSGREGLLWHMCSNAKGKHDSSTIQDRTMGTRRVQQLKEIMLWNDSRGWNGRSIFRKITEILRVETILHKSYRVLIPGCSERIITFSGLSRQDVARFFTTSVQNRHEKSCYYYYLYYFQSLWFSLQFYFFAARWSTILQGDCTKLSQEDFLQFF